MDPATLAVVTTLLKLGLPGVVILGLSWMCRMFYLDLKQERKNTDKANDETNEARKELDEARQDTIRFLERLLTEMKSKRCRDD